MAGSRHLLSVNATMEQPRAFFSFFFCTIFLQDSQSEQVCTSQHWFGTVGTEMCYRLSLAGARGKWTPMMAEMASGNIKNMGCRLAVGVGDSVF